METANIMETRAGILYPVMLIAAIAVIVFSMVGIAMMMGWLPSASSKHAPAGCGDCGVIESIHAVEVKGEGTGAGAYAGHEIEKNMNRSTRYQVRVRMNDGTYRMFYEPSQPALSIGQKVRVTDQEFVGHGADKLLGHHRRRIGQEGAK